MNLIRGASLSIPGMAGVYVRIVFLAWWVSLRGGGSWREWCSRGLHSVNELDHLVTEQSSSA
ncbi:hypothetical protein E5345_04930 [Propionibacterium sp. NM47_B9-13]|nr:hypothetical protein E5345_04930 [Propionibacterium sp. NM47_B9-13]